jgi:uncharacterized membrane protein
MSRREHYLHKHFGDGRSFGDRAADAFVAKFGSWSYIIWQTVLVVAWIVGNIWFLKLLFQPVPDPYPFILLNLFFSTQASYAAPLILMAQNRASARDKDFATHQFEIIEDVHTMLKQNTELTREVHRFTCERDK